MPIAIIVDWHGPYQGIDEFRRSIKDYWHEYDKCLYMALGRHNKMRYIGLTKNPGVRFAHHRKMHDPDNVRFYIGIIVSQGVTGRRKRRTRPDLDIAEHVLISKLNPELNTYRKSSNFADCVSIYSRFFGPNEDSEPTRKLAKFPEFVGYNSYSDSIRIMR